MAADTATKRYSAMLLALPWRGCLPLPDNAVGQADRVQLMFLYAGVLPLIIGHGLGATADLGDSGLLAESGLIAPSEGLVDLSEGLVALDAELAVLER